MKIAIIADPLDNQRAGVHVYTQELINSLMAEESEHEYILIREKVDPNLDIRQIAVPNIRLPIGFASLRLFFIIPIIARFLKVDAVFEPAHFGPFNLPSRVKRITMIHDLTPILFSKYHRFHSQLLQKIFLKNILRQADLVLSNSQNTTKDLEQVYPFTKTKIKTILLGKEMTYQPTASRSFHELHDIDDPYFLYVGTIEPRKNLSMLLDAFLLFREEYSLKIRLLIVGQKGWKADEFYQILEEHPFRNDILLTGFVEQKYLPELYSHSLGLIYPSEYEGFGLPVVEALSCGTNVICPKNSSLTEVGGDLAFYFPTNDTKALVELMHLVAKQGEEVKRKRVAGPEWTNRFSWKNYAEEFNQALSQLS